MDATGWENMEYRGYLMGETPRSIRAKMQPIAEFSELGRFLDVPVRYYSAGMLVRLAFSISTSIEPDILIVDEVLSAGDMEFQAKARTRMKALIASARAVVIVSHDMSSALAIMRPRVVARSRHDPACGANGPGDRRLYRAGDPSGANAGGLALPRTDRAPLI